MLSSPSVERGSAAIACSVCKGRHPLGIHAVGDRVIVAATLPRPDGLQAGTKGVVVAYVIVAGAKHQEVHVRRKGGRVAVFAPCELGVEPQNQAPVAAALYKSVSHEEFRALMRQPRVGRFRISVSLDDMDRRPAADLAALSARPRAAASRRGSARGSGDLELGPRARGVAPRPRP